MLRDLWHGIRLVDWHRLMPGRAAHLIGHLQDRSQGFAENVRVLAHAKALTSRHRTEGSNPEGPVEMI